VKSRQAATSFILVTLFLDVVGIGLIVPIVPNLVKQFVGGSSELASHYTGPLLASYALAQFVFGSVIGSLSDRFGRRPVLLLAVTGQGLDYVLMGFAPSLSWLFVGRIIAGVAGASFGTATAYIADVTAPEKRAASFGLIGGAFGLGFIVGPLIGGVLGKVSLHLPFFVAAGLALVNAAYGWFVLPESLAVENRRPFSWSRANPVGTLRSLWRYPLVRAMLVPLALSQLAQRCVDANWVLANTERFGWDEQDAGISLAAVGLSTVLVRGGVLRQVLKRLGERRTFVMGVVVASLTTAAYGFATASWVLYVIIPIGALGGLALPTMTAILSEGVPANEQGLLQGGVTSLQSLTSIAGPLLANFSFGYFISDAAPVRLPGVSFLIGGLLWAMCLGLSLVAFKAHPAKVRVLEAVPA
jgi:DHA1 family tetracycline resistance protein-like MFS transporter